MKKKVYLASGISDVARKQYQKDVAEKIRDSNYEVYAAAENDSINDKSNNPTPKDIYMGDVSEILKSDIFAQIISGAGEDGTNYESGVVAGINEMIVYYNEIIDNVVDILENKDSVDKAIDTLKDSKKNVIDVLAFTSNERLLQPQFYKGEREDIIGLASGGYNHLILGGIDKWGLFLGGLDDLINKLQELNKEK